jgi:hypothetical protein
MHKYLDNMKRTRIYGEKLYPIKYLAYFPSFEKIEVGLCDHHAVCVSPQYTFE